jgi:hypothetical protein
MVVAGQLYFTSLYTDRRRKAPASLTRQQETVPVYYWGGGYSRGNYRNQGGSQLSHPAKVAYVRCHASVNSDVEQISPFLLHGTVCLFLPGFACYYMYTCVVTANSMERSFVLISCWLLSWYRNIQPYMKHKVQFSIHKSLTLILSSGDGSTPH